MIHSFTISISGPHNNAMPSGSDVTTVTSPRTELVIVSGSLDRRKLWALHRFR